MDIRCPICGEPWDHDELHEMFTKDGRRMSYQAAVKSFQKLGCEAFGSTHNKPMDKETAKVAKTIYDLLGDDMDGAASTMEDFLME